VAYRLARTLHGVEFAFCKKLAQGCETTAANTVAAAPKPELIHPGVMAYLKEIGVAK
ncbi:MAG: TAXI family TRAP transporter solute-binding subunit, partial [Bradyrhizobium sp.]